MRIERWYWLPVFCTISLLVHIGLVLKSRSFASTVPIQPTVNLEVELQPLEQPKLEPKKEPPKPPVTPEPKKERPKEPSPVKAPPERHVAKAKPERGAPFDKKVEKAPQIIARNVPTAPNVDPGGVFNKLREEKPLPSGLPSGKRD